VRVGGVAVGPLHAGLERTQLRHDRADARVGGVDVQPDAVLVADRSELGEGVEGRRRRRPHGGAQQHRPQAAGGVALQARGQRGGTHREVAVDLHDPDGVGAEAGDAHRLLHGGVRLGRDVDRVLLGDDAVPDGGPTADAVQRRQQGDQVGARAGVLDDAPAGAGRAEGCRQVEQLGEPVHEVLLELGGRRAGHPGHALDAEAGGDQVAQHRGPRGVGREVAEEAGVLPVGQPGDDDPVEVGEDGGEGLALLGG
jgi:hypothetical protein